MPPDQTRIGFLGAGQMARALARGWLDAGLIAADRCAASDPSAGARESFTASTGIAATPSNRAVVGSTDVLVLAVKPQHMGDLLVEIRPAVDDQLVVSIAAGVSLAQLRVRLDDAVRVIRVMPNTACQVQACAAAYAAGPTARPEDVAIVDRLLNAVGRAFAVPEKLLDAVTGLSGSGPAFVYAVIESLSDGGVFAGLPRDVATALAAQTVLGAAKMVLETGRHPGELKDQVTSPGGTTIHGLAELERGGVRAALMSAVAAAARRAEELSRQP